MKEDKLSYDNYYIRKSCKLKLTDLEKNIVLGNNGLYIKMNFVYNNKVNYLEYHIGTIQYYSINNNEMLIIIPYSETKVPLIIIGIIKNYIPTSDLNEIIQKNNLYNIIKEENKISDGIAHKLTRIQVISYLLSDKEIYFSPTLSSSNSVKLPIISNLVKKSNVKYELLTSHNYWILYNDCNLKSYFKDINDSVCFWMEQIALIHEIEMDQVWSTLKYKKTKASNYRKMSRDREFIFESSNFCVKSKNKRNKISNILKNYIEGMGNVIKDCDTDFKRVKFYNYFRTKTENNRLVKKEDEVLNINSYVKSELEIYPTMAKLEGRSNTVLESIAREDKKIVVIDEIKLNADFCDSKVLFYLHEMYKNNNYKNNRQEKRFNDAVQYLENYQADHNEKCCNKYKEIVTALNEAKDDYYGGFMKEIKKLDYEDQKLYIKEERGCKSTDTIVDSELRSQVKFFKDDLIRIVEKDQKILSKIKNKELPPLLTVEERRRNILNKIKKFNEKKENLGRKKKRKNKFKVKEDSLNKALSKIESNKETYIYPPNLDLFNKKRIYKLKRSKQSEIINNKTRQCYVTKLTIINISDFMDLLKQEISDLDIDEIFKLVHKPISVLPIIIRNYLHFKFKTLLFMHKKLFSKYGLSFVTIRYDNYKFDSIITNRLQIN
jgi:hypothetical protein